MIAYDQQILADPARGDGHDAQGRPGDCWKACIASLLDIEDYDTVPHFVTFDDWWGETHRYIWEATGQSLRKWRDTRHIPEGIDLLIGTGPSPRGNFHHAVIVDRDGNLVHDPHPSRAGLVEVEDFFAVEPAGCNCGCGKSRSSVISEIMRVEHLNADQAEARLDRANAARGAGQ